MQLDIWGNPSVLVINDVIITQTYLNSKLLKYSDNTGTSWESSWGPYPDLEYKCEFIDFENEETIKEIINGYIRKDVKNKLLTFSLDMDRILKREVYKTLSVEIRKEIDRDIIRRIKEMA